MISIDISAKLMNRIVKYQKNDRSGGDCLSVERDVFFWYY